MMVLASVRDDAVKCFMPPFCCRSRGEAQRIFLNAVGETASEFHKHPKDFVLFYLGEFDEHLAKFTLCSTPEPLLTALDALNMRDGV